MRAEPEFEISVPAWRARRLRNHLAAQRAAGRAAKAAGESRIVPSELAHRAEARCWLSGWDQAGPDSGEVKPAPTARQLLKLDRWERGAGRLSQTQGQLRREILENVTDELLANRPLRSGALANAHREAVRRCRDAGLPAPKASRYRKWLKLIRGI